YPARATAPFTPHTPFPHWGRRFTEKGGLFCHALPQCATSWGVSRVRREPAERTGPPGRARATHRCSLPCPARGCKAAAVVTGLASRALNAETLSPETFGARSEQACYVRTPNDLSNCGERVAPSRIAETLEKTGGNANSRGGGPRLLVLTRVPQS